MANVSVKMPDGTVINNIPEGTTRAQIKAKLQANNSWNDAWDAPTEGEAAPVDEAKSQAKSLRGVAGKIVQGATLGFGDEIMAGLSAPVVSALSQFTDNPRGVGEIYEGSRDLLRADLEAASEEFPVASFVGEVAGGLGTGGALANLAKRGVTSASPAVASALGSFARANPKTAGALTAGGVGSIYGAGAAEEGERGAGALFGGGVSAPFGAVGGALSRSNLIPRTSSSAVPTSEGLRAKASNLYFQASKAGGKLKPAATKKLLKDLSVSAAPKNVVEKTLRGENVIAKSMDDLGISLKNGATYDELHSLEKMLGELANDNVVAATGKLTAKGNSFKETQKQLRNFIETIPEKQFEGGKLAFDLKKQADKMWSQSLKVNEVEKVLNRASLQDQTSTGIRSGLRTILSNPNRTRSFSPEELKVMRQAAEMDLPTSALRAMGSRLLPTFAAGGTAATGFNPAGIAATAGLYGVSGLARRGADARQLGKASDLVRLLENPSALTKKVDLNSLLEKGVQSGILGKQFIPDE